MPTREGRIYSFGELNQETFKGLPGMLADSLPDTYGRALFDKWLALTGRTSGNAIESLCFMGTTMTKLKQVTIASLTCFFAAVHAQRPIGKVICVLTTVIKTSDVT